MHRKNRIAIEAIKRETEMTGSRLEYTHRAHLASHSHPAIQICVEQTFITRAAVSSVHTVNTEQRQQWVFTSRWKCMTSIWIREPDFLMILLTLAFDILSHGCWALGTKRNCETTMAINGEMQTENGDFHFQFCLCAPTAQTHVWRDVYAISDRRAEKLKIILFLQTSKTDFVSFCWLPPPIDWTSPEIESNSHSLSGGAFGHLLFGCASTHAKPKRQRVNISRHIWMWIELKWMWPGWPLLLLLLPLV